MNTVGALEQKLFAIFPAKHATSGDRIGLLVGNPQAKVEGIALALDAKESAIKAASCKGCNVLVTHHPPFWHVPQILLKGGSSEGASVYCAAELGISLISMHTNLDCAPLARELLLDPVGFKFVAPLSLPEEFNSDLEPICKAATQEDREEKQLTSQIRDTCPALGQLGKPQEGAVLFEELVRRYKEAFGAVAKAWGRADKPIKTLAACSGGGGSLVQHVVASRADCYVTGELAYHEALELAESDIALIELGHDRSELPYRFILKEALVAAGINRSRLHVLDPVASWWQ